MGRKTLTSKQEKFCQAIAVDKMNQSDAYRTAYDTENMKDKSIHEKASELASNVKVSSRIASIKSDLYDKLQEEIVYSKKQSFDNLSEIQELAKGKGQYNVATKNEELKGKMLGYYEDTLNLKGDKNNPIESKLTVTFINKNNK